MSIEVTAGDTSGTTGPPQDPVPLNLPTWRALVSLRAALSEDRRLPVMPGSDAAALVLDAITAEQSSAALRQLRDRYTATKLAGREFTKATLAAAEWGRELTRDTNPSEVDDLVFAALVATLARRLVVDGPALTRSTVAACHRAVAGAPAQRASLPGHGTSEKVITGT